MSSFSRYAKFSITAVQISRNGVGGMARNGAFSASRMGLWG